MGASEENHFHYICTREKAFELAQGHETYWVSNCGCREGREEKTGVKCQRSRVDVCLFWNEADPGSGSGKTIISWPEVLKLFSEARELHLVTRPFHNDQDYSQTDGVCFCCDDCCGYFPVEEDQCGRGEKTEQTDLTGCNQCSTCVDVCYFGARKMDGEKLKVEHDKCYGCGLCLDVCPTDCIKLVDR